MKFRIAIGSLFLSLTSFLAAEEFAGVEFPDGVVSFADEVVAYVPIGNVGDTVASHSLGPPNYSSGRGSVTLGVGGRITVRFTDNVLTGSDSDQPDLHIFEVGHDVEDTLVEISRDGIVWHDVGKVFGSISSIDIDAFGFNSTDRFEYVRLTDDPDEGERSGSTAGADIDAVGAISTTAVVHTPVVSIEPAVMVSFLSVVGSHYVVEKSTDLENWATAVAEISGNGSLKKFFFEAKEPREVYRVRPASH